MDFDSASFLKQARDMGLLSSERVHELTTWISQDPARKELPVLSRILLKQGLLSGDQMAHVLGALANPVSRSGRHRHPHRPVRINLASFADAISSIEQRERQASLVDTPRSPFDTVAPSAGDGIGSHPASKYETRAQIEEGGMGVVWLAGDRHLGREVAIKTLRHPENVNQLKRFFEEAQVTGQLEHPNILPVYDLGFEPESQHPFLVMKWVRGRDFDQVIQGLKKGRPTGLGGARKETETPTRALSRLLDAFLKICDAVAYAHSRGVIHRDLKPKNVMTGEFGEVLVMDWGLAKPISSGSAPRPSAGGPEVSEESDDQQDDSEDLGITLQGEMLGTPLYMPPEQSLGQIDRVDFRSDIYSLGALLYEILSLERPIAGETNAEIIARVRHGTVEPPSERSSAPWPIPEELDVLVLTAMSRRRRDRYQTVAEFKADLQAWMEGRTVSAVEYSNLQVLDKWARRNRRSLALAAAALVLALGVWALIERVEYQQQGAFEARRQADKAHQRKKQQRDVQDRLERAAVLGQTLDMQSVMTRVDALQDLDSLDDWIAWHQALQETESERDTRSSALQHSLDALDHLNHVLDMAPGSQKFKDRWRATGEQVAWILLLGHNYTMARHSFDKLEREHLPSDHDRRNDLVFRAQRWRQAVDWASAAPAQARAQRLRDILRDLRRGLARPDRDPTWPLMEEHVREAAGFTDLQTVVMLREALDPLVVKGRLEDRNAIWSQEERDLAIFCSRVLGSLNLSEALEPLTAWLDAVWDHELAVEAGRALCDSRRREALEPLEQALKRLESQPATTRAIRHSMPRIWATLEKEEPGDDAGLLRRAQARYHQGNLDGALADLDRLIDQDPSNLAALMSRADIREEQRDLQGALDDLDRVVEFAPQRTHALMQRGLVHHAMGDMDQALADLQQSLELDPSSAEAWHSLGYVYQALGDLETAMDYYQQAIKIEPSFVDALLARGTIQELRGELDAAATSYSEVIQIDQDRETAWYNRGLVLLRKGNLVLARRDFSRAIDLNPRSADAYLNRGAVLQLLGEHKQAEEDYSQAIKLDPGNPDAWRNRGVIRSLLGEIHAAVRDYERALQVAPEDWEERARIQQLLQYLPKPPKPDDPQDPKEKQR